MRSTCQGARRRDHSVLTLTSRRGAESDTKDISTKGSYILYLNRHMSRRHLLYCRINILQEIMLNMRPEYNSEQKLTFIISMNIHQYTYSRAPAYKTRPQLLGGGWPERAGWQWSQTTTTSIMKPWVWTCLDISVTGIPFQPIIIVSSRLFLSSHSPFLWSDLILQVTPVSLCANHSLVPTHISLKCISVTIYCGSESKYITNSQMQIRSRRRPFDDQ